MRKTILTVVAVLVGTGLFATSAQAAPSLTVKGKLTNPQARMQVLFIASDGTSVYANVNKKSGAFTMSSKNAKFVKSFAPGKKGTGTSLQLVRAGSYAGPFLLRAKGKQGFGRLAPTVKGKLDLGKVTLKSKGYVAVRNSVEKGLIDTKHPMTLVKGVPLGAGTFGATGALKSASLRQRGSVEVVPEGARGLGDDADKDGVVNAADVDMNGDGVLDAAQSEEPATVVAGQAEGEKAVLEDRPFQAIQFKKILDAGNTSNLNSNITAGVTWDSLSTYLSTQLHIEVVIASGDLKQLFCPASSPDAPLCAEALNVARVTMDCTQLSYCSADSGATITASKISGNDGKPLSSLMNAQGTIELPIDTASQNYVPGKSPAETGLQLNFKPNVTGDAAGFVGDSFVFTFFDANGSELARQVKVLTSSTATASAWKSVGGGPVSLPLLMSNASTLTAAQANALELVMYRPQQLNPESSTSPILLDRGGLTYKAYLMSSTGFYYCRPQAITLSGSNVSLIERNMMPGALVQDNELEPANGGTISYSVNVNDCLTSPLNMGPATPTSPPATGSNLTLEVETADSDGNNTRLQVYLKAP